MQQQAEFKCPHCAAVFKAPPSLEGESSECPRCNQDVDRWPAPVSRPLLRQQPAGAAASSTAVWFYAVGDQRRGPVTEAQLKSLVEIGSLRPTDLLWRDGMPSWVEAGQLPGLFPVRPAPLPPAPIPPHRPAVAPPQAAVVDYPYTEGPGRATQECPYCCEPISVRAKRCPVCGETIDVAMREAEEARREAREARRESQRRPRREVVYRDRRPTCPHVLHLILTIFTAGLWLPIWIIHAIIVESS